MRLLDLLSHPSNPCSLLVQLSITASDLPPPPSVPSHRRRAAVSDLLLRHVTLDLPSDVRDRLVNNFGIPVPVLSYAQAVRARALGRRRDEARLLLLAERWQEGHDLLVQHIAPECIINGEW